MRCPHCQEQKTSVLDSRAQGDYRWRRRFCRSCGHRFSTIEKVLIKRKKERRRETESLGDMGEEEIDEMLDDLR